jgi:hypothetical protein
MPLLKINADGSAKRIISKNVDLERSVQRIMEENLKEALDIDFVASEYCIQGGRMDTLGIDSTGSPVIIEYKKGSNSSVLAQSAFYYIWLSDHKADFEKLVKAKGIEQTVDWSNPRLICMAEAFNFYDYSAVKVLKIKVELLKYRFYGDDMLYLTTDKPLEVEERLTGKTISTPSSQTPKSNLTLDELMSGMPENTKGLFLAMRESVLNFSGDIQDKINSTGISYRVSSTLFCDSNRRKNGNGIVVYFPTTLLPQELLSREDLKEGKRWTSYNLENKSKLDELMKIVEVAYESAL